MEQASDWRLAAGRYLVKAYVDVNERLCAEEYVAEAVAETKWPRG
jgi:hypothetical protein